jgi:hypothetical protein
MNFKMIAAAAALVAAGTANASLDNFLSANSSVVFFGYNTTTGTSVIADLGVSLNDFMPAYTVIGDPGAVAQGQLDQAGAKAVWNFNANTLSVNGSLVNGPITNNWSTNFASFLSSVGSSNFKWGVIAGDNTSNVDAVGKYLTSGNPTDQNLIDQSASQTANMGQVNALYTNLASKLGSAANGSYYAASPSDTGYVAKNTNFNTQGNWLTNLGFQAVVNGSTAAASTSALSLIVEDGTNYRVGVDGTAFGHLTLDAVGGTLTWQAAGAVTPSVPEPSSYGLALVGLAAAFVARRRAAK